MLWCLAVLLVALAATGGDPQVLPLPHVQHIPVPSEDVSMSGLPLGVSPGMGVAEQQLAALMHVNPVEIRSLPPPTVHPSIVLAIAPDEAAQPWLKLHNVSSAELATLSSEGYILSVAAQGVLLLGKDKPGAFYAVQTMQQLLNHSGVANHTRAQRIVDSPDTPVRGLYLETHTMLGCNASWLRHAADVMSAVKMNTAIVTAGYFAAADGKNTSCGDARTNLLDAHEYFASRHINVVPQLEAGDAAGWTQGLYPSTTEGIWVRNETFVVGQAGELSPAHPFETGLPINGNFQELDATGQPLDWVITPGFCSVDRATAPSWSRAQHSLRCTQNTSWLPRGQHTSVAYSSKVSGIPGGIFALSFALRSVNTTCGTSTPSIRLILENQSNKSEAVIGSFSGERTNWGDLTWQNRSIVAATPVGSRLSEPATNLTIYVEVMSTRVQPPQHPGCDLEWWVADMRVHRLSAGMRNVIRSSSTDFQLSTSSGDPLKPGRDYMVTDPPAGNLKPASTTMQGWDCLEACVITMTSTVLPGTVLNVSYDLMPGLPGEVMNSLASPEYYTHMEWYVNQTMERFKPRHIFFVHDEIRGIGRDSRSISSGLSNAALLANSMNTLHEYMQRVDNRSSAWFWDDMVNPYHNGRRADYQLAWGGKLGATDGALNMTNIAPGASTPSIGWLSWWYSSDDFDGKMGNASQVFGERPWFGCSGGSLENMRMWGKIMADSPGARGLIDTNWITSLPIDQWPNLTAAADYGWNLLHESRE